MSFQLNLKLRRDKKKPKVGKIFAAFGGKIEKNEWKYWNSVFVVKFIFIVEKFKFQENTKQNQKNP